MGQTIAKSRKRKKTKPFNPQRDYVNDAVRDYLQRGGKITKIVDDSEDYDYIRSIPDEIPPANGIMNGY